MSSDKFHFAQMWQLFLMTKFPWWNRVRVLFAESFVRKSKFKSNASWNLEQGMDQQEEVRLPLLEDWNLNGVPPFCPGFQFWCEGYLKLKMNFSLVISSYSSDIRLSLFWGRVSLLSMCAWKTVSKQFFIKKEKLRIKRWDCVAVLNNANAD